MVDLPPGFVLDQPEVQAPDPPPGFVADAPPDPIPEPEPEPQPVIGGGALDASVNGLVQGLTGNFSDELFAAIATPFRAGARAVTGADEGEGFLDRLSNAYNIEVEGLRSRNRQLQEENPGAFLAGEITGALGAGAAAAKGGVSLLANAQPTARSLIGRGAAEGAIAGSIFGAGAGEGFEDTAKQTAFGAGIGAVTGGGAGAVALRQARKAANKVIKSVDTLRVTKNQAYIAAESAGQTVPAARLSAFSGKLQESMLKRGINLGQHPKSSGALDSFVKNSGGDMSLSNIDLLRRNFLDAAMSGDPSEARLAGIMLNRLDNFIDNVPGGPLWRDARKAHKTFRKSATVERLIDRAKLRAEQFSNSGMDNALQVEFRQFARNDKLMKGFTKTEQDAIRAVAQDGVTSRVFRKLGKLAPSSGVIANMLHLMTASVNLPLAVGLMAVGEGGKQAARVIRQGSARRASELVRSGGQAPQRQLTKQQQEIIDTFLLAGTQQAQGALGP